MGIRPGSHARIQKLLKLVTFFKPDAKQKQRLSTLLKVASHYLTVFLNLTQFERSQPLLKGHSKHIREEFCEVRLKDMSFPI